MKKGRKLQVQKIEGQVLFCSFRQRNHVINSIQSVVQAGLFGLRLCQNLSFFSSSSLVNRYHLQGKRIIIISMYQGGAMKQNRETESVFFFDKAQCASCFRVTRLFVSKTRHEASNQEGQGKPLRSLTSHRRVNDLRGAPRPSWLRALCQVFDTKKLSFPKRMTSMLLSQEEKN